MQLFGLLPPWYTPHGDSPRPPPSVGERVRPVRCLQRDVELAALTGELVHRAAELGYVDGRRHLDLTQRVALRLLRGCSREFVVDLVANRQYVATCERGGERLTLRGFDRNVKEAWR